MRVKGLVLGVVCVLLTLAMIPSGFALTKGFEASSFHPAVDGGPFITLYGAETLPQWRFNLGTTANFAYRPFQLTRNGVRARGVIDDALAQDFYMSVGLLNRWLQLGLDIPVFYWLKYTDPNVAAATAQNKMAMGDIQLNVKTELLPLKDRWIGIALLPFITFPTGKGEYYAGNGGVAGGGKLIFEFKPIKRLHIGLNAGVLARQSFTVLDIVQSSQLLYGLGFGIDATKRFTISAEVSGRARLADLFGKKEESPAEADVGVQYAFGESGVSMNLGGGAGIIRGSGAPTFRTYAGVNYRQQEKKAQAVPVKKDPLDDVRNARVHFSFDNREFASLDDAETLIAVVEALKAVPDVRVRIVGYADNSGKPRHNQALSLSRAREIKRYLVGRGIDTARLEIKGKGESNPIGDNTTKAGRAENRRVEFEIIE